MRRNWDGTSARIAYKIITHDICTRSSLFQLETRHQIKNSNTNLEPFNTIQKHTLTPKAPNIDQPQNETTKCRPPKKQISRLLGGNTALRDIALFWTFKTVCMLWFVLDMRN